MNTAPAVFWFRRDLRLADNPALHAALKEHAIVWPVYLVIRSEWKKPAMGGARAMFWLESLRALERSIERAGVQLIIRVVENNPWTALEKIGRVAGARSLYWNRAYEPTERARDEWVAAAADAAGWRVRTYQDGMLREPADVLKKDGRPFTVFTPYARAWNALGKKEFAPVSVVRWSARGSAMMRQLGRKLKSDAIPTLKSLGFSCVAALPLAGEAAAQARLRGFIREALFTYASERDFPAKTGTSRLSVDLSAGTIGIRTVYAAAVRASKSKSAAAKRQAAVFVKELIWRDFFRQILWHHPRVAQQAFRSDYNTIPWPNSKALFAAWCQGRTGYPIVDAAMRQLNATGWMHNRLRMIAASFLVKDLLVSWQWGERYFFERLVDADLAANNGGWQWAAGTGTDAQPYFRIFNPTLQTRKFDPQEKFIRRWIPELGTAHYPRPIVEHAAQRVKVLALFKQARASRPAPLMPADGGAAPIAAR